MDSYASSSPEEHTSSIKKEDKHITAKELQELLAEKNVNVSESCCKKMLKVRHIGVKNKFSSSFVEKIIDVSEVFNVYVQEGVIQETQLAPALEEKSPYKHHWKPGFLQRLIKTADPENERGINLEQFLVIREGIVSFISNQRWLSLGSELPTYQQFQEFVLSLLTDNMYHIFYYATDK